MFYLSYFSIFCKYPDKNNTSRNRYQNTHFFGNILFILLFILLQQLSLQFLRFRQHLPQLHLITAFYSSWYFSEVRMLPDFLQKQRHESHVQNIGILDTAFFVIDVGLTDHLQTRLIVPSIKTLPVNDTTDMKQNISVHRQQ